MGATTLHLGNGIDPSPTHDQGACGVEGKALLLIPRIVNRQGLMLLLLCTALNIQVSHQVNHDICKAESQVSAST